MGFWQWEWVDHVKPYVDIGGWTREKWGGGADRGKVDVLGGGGDVWMETWCVGVPYCNIYWGTWVHFLSPSLADTN